MGGKKGLRHTLADFRPGPAGLGESERLDIWADRPSSAHTENPIVRARPGGLLAFDRKDLHINSETGYSRTSRESVLVVVTSSGSSPALRDHGRVAHGADPLSCFHTPPFYTSDMRQREPNGLTKVERRRLLRWESCAADSLPAFNRRRGHRQGSLSAALRGGPLAVNAIAGYFGHIPRKYVENVYGLPFMRANAVSSSLGKTTQDARAAAKWKIEVGGASKSKRMARHIEVADRARRRAMRNQEHRNSVAVETWCANMENPTKLHNAWRDYGIVGYKGFKPFWKTDKDFHLKKRELGKPNPPYLPRASYHTILVGLTVG
ncbi:hypothetical protein FOZ63_025884 [Perkinsus olseni]|uniref:Uncharacterized protein n=1 Tax=Perkinsus olseni TaxID=32597 RepID=A0A7J6UDG7_PEROL|nr:hypothetical protein FOZ63_025884 [Perkinsus olseni]